MDARPRHPGDLDPGTLADALERELRAAGTAARAAQEKRYLRSSLEHLGAGAPAIRGAVRTLRRAHPGLGRDALIMLVEELWTREIFELRSAAIALLVTYRQLLGPGDVTLLERLLRESRTWALVDALAVHCLGHLAEQHPPVGRLLLRWSRDPDFWIRRSALLAHLCSLREGRGDLSAFGRLADPLLGDREFFIRKAIGWVLRDAGKRDPAGVVRWLRPRAARAAPLTIREAVKYLPARAAARIRAAAAGRRPR